MTNYLTALRILLVVAFFINITALFITHYGVNRFPCDNEDILKQNDFWCVGEMNPIAKNLMVFGFWGHFGSMMIIWSMIFLWWERRILRKEPWSKYAWIPAIGFTVLLSMDLLNDIYVLADTFVKTGL